MDGTREDWRKRPPADCSHVLDVAHGEPERGLLDTVGFHRVEGECRPQRSGQHSRTSRWSVESLLKEVLGRVGVVLWEGGRTFGGADGFRCQEVSPLQADVPRPVSHHVPGFSFYHAPCSFTVPYSDIDHAKRQVTFIAVAVIIYCTWVLTRPMEQLRRRSKARTPWERVPSIPAHLAERLRNAGIFCRSRAL